MEEEEAASPLAYQLAALNAHVVELSENRYSSPHCCEQRRPLLCVALPLPPPGAEKPFVFSMCSHGTIVPKQLLFLG